MKVSQTLLERFQSCKRLTDKFEKRLAIASIITEAFRENGLPAPIMVGGAAVATYTGGEYGTHDTDFIADLEGQEYEVVKQLGYIKINKNCFNNELDSLIEFPTGPLAGNRDRVYEYIVDTTGYPIYLISIEDLILDRIDAFDATNDHNSREWALRMMVVMYAHMEWSYLHSESHRRKTFPITEKIQKEAKRLIRHYNHIVQEQAVTSDMKQMKLH